MYPNSRYFGLTVVPIFGYFGAKVSTVWVHGPLKDKDWRSLVANAGFSPINLGHELQRCTGLNNFGA